MQLRYRYRLEPTQAKRTPERAGLGEVSAVVLQQSVADLHRAYRNYFRALSAVKAEHARGTKTKLGVRKPRLKSKRGKQAARFTANSRFRVRPNGRLSLPKIGGVAVRWSRMLPAPPSSVTVTLDRSGRYHASFVVEVAQRILSRRRKGSANWHKAKRRVARLHTHVTDARRDLHHQLSTRLIRENQAVYLEDLNVAALGRSHLAKSLADAAWGQFTAMLIYKADLYGRTVTRLDRRYPSSQLCSACGAKTGPKGQAGRKIRAWTCSACTASHDRDVNAARNLLTAGRAVTACGGHVRPGFALAVAAAPSGTQSGTTPRTAA